jgi:hypothetical protein
MMETMNLPGIGHFIQPTDDADVKKRISKAYQSMGMLYNLWNNKFVDKRTKYLFFLTIPVNLLLWGCKSWALRESLLDKLDAFIHKSIRRILGINIEQFKEQRIKNKQVREQFFNIPDARKMIAARQLSFVRKSLRRPTKTIYQNNS